MYELGIEEPVLPSALRPLFPEQRMVGIAHTVLGSAIEPVVSWDAGVERITSYLNVFEELKPDSILVSVNRGSTVGHFGELTANAAKAQGCAGVVLDGNLRDLSPKNAIGRWEMVGHQVPVEIGDVTISPGDLIFAEFEGVLVVPERNIAEVLEKAEEIIAAEALVRAEVQSGSTPLESFDRHGHI